MDQAAAIWADGEVGTGRYDPPERDGILTTAALVLDLSEPPGGSFALDDTFIPVRWKV